MKNEQEAITADEWLIRLVYHDRFQDSPPEIAASSFEPRVKGRTPDTDGISLFRASRISDPSDVLQVIAEEKRDSYGIVLLPVARIQELGLSIESRPISTIPGHVVVPELNASDYSANKSKFVSIKQKLAELASEHIVRRPGGS